MNRASRTSIIPKIIIFLGTLSVVGIILLFFRRDDVIPPKRLKPDTDDKLFSEIIRAAEPHILKLWTEGHTFLKGSTQCKEELIVAKNVGSSYYDCQPHFWQCYWQGGVTGSESGIKVELFGQEYTVKANPAFSVIPAFSPYQRYYEFQKTGGTGFPHSYGIQIELSIQEIPNFSQRIFLADSCRDTYLPERIYGYGKRPQEGEGFLWDNFGRRIFVDRFYVSQQMANEWRVLTKNENKIVSERELWPQPALLTVDEQKSYCAFFGKRLLTAEIFDAASMSPTDYKNPKPLKVTRTQTPWQRDLSKSFLGVARINPDYQLTPLDCQLAQVKGCKEKFYTSDSASWMGMNYSLGFHPESLTNTIESLHNLKLSSRDETPASKWHELGLRSSWDGKTHSPPVAFRCYEEVEP